MSPPKISSLFEIGRDVLSTAISAVTGFVTAQVGDVVTAQVTGDESEWWQHVGFVSRPRKPDAGSKAAQVIQIKRSDHDAIIASRDERTKAIYVALDDGETAVFASVGDAVVFFRKDGSIDVTGSAVRIGDTSAVTLAKSQAITDLQAAINGWTAVPNDGGAALKVALATWLANTSYATTKAKGT